MAMGNSWIYLRYCLCCCFLFILSLWRKSQNYGLYREDSKNAFSPSPDVPPAQRPPCVRPSARRAAR